MVYHVTRDWVIPIQKKSEAIQALAVPKNRKQLGQFISMINFYRDMWKKRSELLAPLTDLTSKNVKYNWKENYQKFFDAIKRVIGREVFLAYQDFNSPFEIHTVSSNYKLSQSYNKNTSPPLYIHER